jgi:DNA-binding protein Fis
MSNKIGKSELNRISNNRKNRKVFNDLTENINIPESRPNIQTKHLSKNVNRNINNLLSSINGQSNNNEKYKFKEILLVLFIVNSQK